MSQFKNEKMNKTLFLFLYNFIIALKLYDQIRPRITEFLRLFIGEFDLKNLCIYLIKN